MINFLLYPLIFFFVWFTIFLWHEIMHIIATGKLKGTIYINGLTISCIPCFPDRFGLVRIMGGVGASLLSFTLVFLTKGFWAFSFFTLGWVNLCYGIYEYFIGVNDKGERYLLYYCVVLFCLLFWFGGIYE